MQLNHLAFELAEFVSADGAQTAKLQYPIADGLLVIVAFGSGEFTAVAAALAISFQLVCCDCFT